MPGNLQPHTVISFGPFAADLQTQELKKHGVRLRLPGQSFQILKMLLERPGELVSREELHAALWPSDTFVDFEKGINAAVKRLREALGDSADNPHVIETLPRRGYRLIAPVTPSIPSAIGPAAEIAPANSKTWGIPRHYRLVILGAFVAAIGVLAVWNTTFRTSVAPRVLRFTRLTDDGQRKLGPMATDGSRIYFTEILPDNGYRIAQVSVKGGEVVPLSVPLKMPQVFDVSSEGTELLVGNDEGSDHFSLWIQPVAGDRRVELKRP
jgi:DNA-binding winged helix-turn-helix (wHTH) protein